MINSKGGLYDPGRQNVERGTREPVDMTRRPAPVTRAEIKRSQPLGSPNSNGLQHNSDALVTGSF